MIRWATIGLLVLIVGMMVVVPNVPGIGIPILNLLAFVWVLLAVSLLLLRRSRRRLYWRPAPEGKREILGVHPQAIELLRKERASTARS
jgi:hypothetical protein